VCIIVYSPPGVGADMGVLRSCWERNTDGAGVMFAEDGRLKIAKGFMKWRPFKRYMKRIGTERKTALPFAFHFRIATHGSITERNCHPFKVHDSMAMMHNGIMSNVPIEKEIDISDSEAFVDLYVKGLEADLSMSKQLNIKQLEYGSPLNDLFDSFIGASKLLFMDNNGETAIVNESLGYWAKDGAGEGMWFSNRLWKPLTVVTKSKYPVSGSGYNYPGYATGYVRQQYGYKSHSNYGKVDKDDKNDKQLYSSNFEETWYCMDCHSIFDYVDVTVTHWTFGNERLVDCPLCGSDYTVEESFLYDMDAKGDMDAK